MNESTSSTVLTMNQPSSRVNKETNWYTEALAIRLVSTLEIAYAIITPALLSSAGHSAELLHYSALSLVCTQNFR